MKSFLLLATLLAVFAAPVHASAEKLTAEDWNRITEQRKLYFIFAERETLGERGAVFSKSANDYVSFMDDEAAFAPKTRDAADLFLAALAKNDPEAARTLAETQAKHPDSEETPSPVVPYSIPIDWIAIESDDPGTEVYETSFDKTTRFFVSIRLVPTGAITAEDWMLEEIVSNRAKGIETIGDPSPYEAGDRRWIKLEWENVESGDRGRRYYLEAPSSHLVEVSIFAKETVFAAGDLTKFDVFLSSFDC